MTTTDTEQPHALIEQQGHVLVVTMNRPQVRNALSGPMLALLRQAWDQVDRDPGIRVCVLTGRHITAAQALQIGLIGHVVPDGQALATALEIAETIAANGPVAVRAILRTIRETEGLPEADAFKIEAQIGMDVFRSEDAKEGPRAFTEKRKPQFRDR